MEEEQIKTRTRLAITDAIRTNELGHSLISVVVNILKRTNGTKQGQEMSNRCVLCKCKIVRQEETCEDKKKHEET